MPQAPRTRIHPNNFPSLNSDGWTQLGNYPECRLQGQTTAGDTLHRSSTSAVAANIVWKICEEWCSQVTRCCEIMKQGIQFLSKIHFFFLIISTRYSRIGSSRFTAGSHEGESSEFEEQSEDNEFTNKGLPSRPWREYLQSSQIFLQSIIITVYLVTVLVISDTFLPDIVFIAWNIQVYIGGVIQRLLFRCW